MHEYTFAVKKTDLCWIDAFGEMKVIEDLGNSIFKVFLRSDLNQKDFDEEVCKYFADSNKYDANMIHG